MPFFAKRLFVGGRLKQYKDSCYDQRFDQYFNQDGMCSFQDIKKYVLLNFWSQNFC